MSPDPCPAAAPTWLTAALQATNVDLNATPIGIVDVGAAGAPPPNQARLAPVSTYLGFDPDLRSPQIGNAFGFRRHSMINRAITPLPQDSVTFHLTKYPECSSVLLPDRDQTHRYAIGEFFEVVGRAVVPAITLDAAIEQAGLIRTDWLKLDTQGTDHDILLSLTPERFDQILAVDVEPGVTAFYHGENTATELHKHMLEKGFWLADLTSQRFPRLSVETIRQLSLSEADVALLDRNPFALELRYFRTIEFLESRAFTVRDYVAMWLIAMANNHTAYAIEVAKAAPRRGLSAEAAQALVDITLDVCRASARKQQPGLFRRTAELCLPPLVLGALRRLKRRLTSTRS